MKYGIATGTAESDRTEVRGRRRYKNYQGTRRIHVQELHERSNVEVISSFEYQHLSTNGRTYRRTCVTECIISAHSYKKLDIMLSKMFVDWQLFMGIVEEAEFGRLDSQHVGFRIKLNCSGNLTPIPIYNVEMPDPDHPESNLSVAELRSIGCRVIAKHGNVAWGFR